MTTTQPHDWRTKGNCARHDPEIFLADDPLAERAAKLLCLGCPVIDECESFAMVNPTIGVWAGMTQPERDDYRPEWLAKHGPGGVAEIERRFKIAAAV